ncbi:MAG: hypothetical protein K2N34_00490 [Lachnospiraceae bacterium]|nr:hypothetical protein [Lachnospiraceae bacterium]
MGLFDRLKKKDETEDEFLLFDNYPFKLAVIQQLMYEQEVMYITISIHSGLILIHILRTERILTLQI